MIILVGRNNSRLSYKMRFPSFASAHQNFIKKHIREGNFNDGHSENERRGFGEIRHKNHAGHGGSGTFERIPLFTLSNHSFR